MHMYKQKQNKMRNVFCYVKFTEQLWFKTIFPKSAPIYTGGTIFLQFAQYICVSMWCESIMLSYFISLITKFMGPTWSPPGSCRPQMGPILAPWTLLSGILWLQVDMIEQSTTPWFITICCNSKQRKAWWITYVCAKLQKAMFPHLLVFVLDLQDMVV